MENKEKNKNDVLLNLSSTEEVKAECRNKLTLAITVLEKLSKGEKINPEYFGKAYKSLLKVDELLNEISD